MPKRSNDFQRLSRRIYEQLMQLGAVVTESAMLRDSDSDTEREIDVLIELAVPGLEQPTRIAIECRDHSRDSDVTWIDGLLGKYRGLPVDRVIAISRQRFTGAAQRKATRCRIETRTLQDALATDWPHDLFELEFTTVVDFPIVTDVRVESQPAWPNGAVPRAIRIGAELVEITGFQLWLRERLERAFAAARQGLGTFCHADFGQQGTHPFSTVITEPRVVLRSEEGTEHNVVELTVYGEIRVEHHRLNDKRYRLGQIGVTHAEGGVSGDHLDVLAVQEPGRNVSIKITSKRVAK